MPRRKIEDMAPPPNLVGACRSVIERLQNAPAARRIRMAYDLGNQLQEVQAMISEARRGAVRELRAEGWTLAAIADAGGITVSRIKQIQDGESNHKKNPPPPDIVRAEP